MIKVSIIVPIYNAGSRLNQCLDTLVNQTLSDIEIICILDLPTDGSDKITEEYAAKDERIILIYNKQNKGVSDSRNLGMAIATGEYIGFSDHDDIRSLDMYELLYFEAKKNDADIVYSDTIIRIDDVDKIYTYNNSTRDGIIRSLILPMDSTNNYLCKSVWSSIYKNNFLKANNLIFKDRDICFSEDTLFNLNAFLSTTNICYFKKPLYVWIKHENSLSEQWITNVGLKLLCFFEFMYADLIKSNQFDNFFKEWVFLIEDSLRVNLYHFQKLANSEKSRLVKLLYISRFPVFGKYKELKFFSKKRIKIYIFNLKLILNYVLS